MKTLLDLEMIENEKEDNLDEIMQVVEKYSLETNDIETKDSIEGKILFIDRIIQDSEEKSSNSNIRSSITSLLKQYFVSAKKESKRENFEFFNKSLDYIIQFSKSVPYESDDFINKYKNILSPVKHLKERRMYLVDTNDYNKAGTIALTHYEILNSNWISKSKVESKDSAEQVIDEWEIEMFFEVNETEAHKPMEFLYQFIEILNSIPGVKIKIESLTIGSLKAKLKATFKNMASKEEVKELLESTKKFAKGKLEKEFDESQKVKKETEKIDAEKELLLQEIEQKASLDTAYLRALEIQSAEEDLKRKRLENSILQLELMKKGFQALSELLAKGIISQKHFEMSIKGLPFISFKGGILLEGGSLDSIDKL
jgi:hypothetical protein